MNTSFPCLLLLLLCAWGATPSESNRECEEKEKSLALLELAKDSINKTKDLVPHCGDEISKNETFHNGSVCGKREKLGAYIKVALELIDEAKENYPNCGFIEDKKPEDEKDNKPDTKEDETPLPGDCSEVKRNGFSKSGVYTLRLQSVYARNKTLDVFCDMDTDEGGWTGTAWNPTIERPFQLTTIKAMRYDQAVQTHGKVAGGFPDVDSPTLTESISLVLMIGKALCGIIGRKMTDCHLLKSR